MSRVSQRIARKRQARLRTLWCAVVGTVVAIVLGLGGAGATYALLTTTSNFSGATVSAGTLDLKINDASSAALGDWAIAPVQPVAKSFKITNIGDAPVTLDATIVPSATTGLAQYAKARLTAVSDATKCVTGLSGSSAALATYAKDMDGGVLAAGQSRYYCFEIGLDSAVPASVSGQSLNFTMTVNGTQSGN